MQEIVDSLSICALVFYLISFLTSLISILKRQSFRKVISFILFIGALLHLIGLLTRTYLVGHAPMANYYETLFFFSFCVALSTLIYNFKYQISKIELISIPVASILLTLAILANHKITPLYLALKTIWFEIHVMASFTAYALFTVSFSAAIFYLFTSAKDRGVAKIFEEMTNSANIWGFSFFSFAMFSGAIWAYLAWGNYWFWEPKTIWSFILWFYFAGIIHGHYLKKWRGKRVAIMTVIGFVVVFFTYIGVGLLMKSSHSL